MEIDLPRNSKDNGKKPMKYNEHGNEMREPTRVQPTEELLSIQLVLGDLEKNTRIGPNWDLDG